MVAAHLKNAVYNFFLSLFSPFSQKGEGKNFFSIYPLGWTWTFVQALRQWRAEGPDPPFTEHQGCTTHRQRSTALKPQQGIAPSCRTQPSEAKPQDNRDLAIGTYTAQLWNYLKIFQNYESLNLILFLSFCPILYFAKNFIKRKRVFIKFSLDCFL